MIVFWCVEKVQRLNGPAHVMTQEITFKTSFSAARPDDSEILKLLTAVRLCLE